MLSPDDMTQTDQITGALVQEPRLPGRRTMVSERRQSILQQKQTDALPALTLGTAESANAKVAWRQVTQLREENRRMRFELESLKSDAQRLLSQYSALQTEFDTEVDTIHSGHRQEIEQYQQHLREMLDERNKLMESNLQLEQRYQELYHSFQATAQAEAHKQAQATTQLLDSSPITPPPLQIADMDTLELPNRQLEEQHLLEALYLKREVERMAEQLKHERQQLDRERTNFLSMQSRAREQLRTEQKLYQARYRAQWNGAITLTTTVAVLLFVPLQLLTLALFHLTFSVPLVMALLIPVILCGALALMLAKPLELAKALHNSAPRKVKAKK